MHLKQIAEEIVAVLERGRYQLPDGGQVVIGSLLAACVQGTEYYDPDALVSIREQVLARPPTTDHTTFEVVNETTLQGCARLAESPKPRHLGALNFASAKHPGGGFLGGAKAQEESLARSSGLYKSLLQCPAYYAFHRGQKTCLYSDRMIYSPGCPVLRTDRGDWLAQPYLVDFITSPAPNAGAIHKNEPHNRAQIGPVFRERSSKLLALAAYHDCEVLVLGAWGCGAFQNDPELVAAIFAEHLKPGGAYWGRFCKVVFSVYDTSLTLNIFNAFARRFADRP